MAVALREEVLRKPLGLTWEPGAFTGEDQSFHAGYFEGQRLVGTLILRPLNDITLRMRQVAVAFDRQGQGIGTALILFAENFARVNGFREITAHARLAAIPFYEKMDYTAEGETFPELSIPHRRIFKRW